MEALIIASRLTKTGSTDPYERPPSGLRRLLIAIGIIVLAFTALQLAADDAATGYGLHETAFAAPEPLK